MTSVGISLHWCLSLGVSVLRGKAWDRSIYLHTYTHYFTQEWHSFCHSVCRSLFYKFVFVAFCHCDKQSGQQRLGEERPWFSLHFQFTVLSLRDMGHPGPVATVVQHSRSSSLSCLHLHIGVSCLRAPSTLAWCFKYICGTRII